MSIGYIEKTTQLKEEDQNFLLNFYTTSTMNIKLEIHKRYSKVFYLLKQKDKEITSSDEISYVSLILSIRTVYNENIDFSELPLENMEIEEIKNIAIRNISTYKEKKIRKRKESMKKVNLLKFLPAIKLYRKEGLSYRDIPFQLKKDFNFEVGYSSVYKFCKELEIVN